MIEKFFARLDKIRNENISKSQFFIKENGFAAPSNLMIFYVVVSSAAHGQSSHSSWVLWVNRSLSDAFLLYSINQKK